MNIQLLFILKVALMLKLISYVKALGAMIHSLMYLKFTIFTRF
jgi:hypothetical protein